MDAISESRLAEVHPLLASKIRQMADTLAQSGVTIRVTQGYRSWTQQLALWLKGRDRTGAVVDKSQVVTNAQPGHSWHNFGLAVDVAPMDNTGQPDWDVNHPVWKQIVAVGESLGLVAGAEWRTFPDFPHFQLTGKFPVSPDWEARRMLKDSGVSAIWKESGLEEA